MFSDSQWELCCRAVGKVQALKYLECELFGD